MRPYVVLVLALMAAPGREAGAEAPWTVRAAVAPRPAATPTAPAAVLPSPAELEIKSSPAVRSLHMRVAAAARAGGDAAGTSGGAAAAPAAGARRPARPSGSLTRALEERLVFRMNLGYGLDAGEPSGERGLSGVSPADVLDGDGNPFAGTRQYALGDLALGTSGLLLPSMSLYFASAFHFDMAGASSFSSFANPYDIAGGRDFLVRAGYAQLDGIGKSGPLARLRVRAGRQFRYGSARFLTSFDGLTLGYEARGYEVSGFAGRRVSLYFERHRDLLGGAGMKLVGNELVGVPVDVALDYLRLGAGGSDGKSARQYIELSSRAKLGPATMHLRGRINDNGLSEQGAQGMGLGRLGARVRYPLGRRVVVVADAERTFAREVVYDLAAPASVDVVRVADELGLALGSPGNATLAGARVSARLSSTLELYAFGAANLVPDPADPEASAGANGFNRPYVELGGALQLWPAPNLELTGQYKLRDPSLDAGARSITGSFADSSGSGIDRMQEMSAELRFRLARSRSSAALSGYARVYDLSGPYVQITNDMRAGARFDIDYWMSKAARIDLAGEVAQPSPTFAPDLGTLVSVRAIMEVVF